MSKADEAKRAAEQRELHRKTDEETDRRIEQGAKAPRHKIREKVRKEFVEKDKANKNTK